MGSYERPRYPAAQLHIAELYRDKLHDHAAARREFERLYERHRNSTKRDDAVWAEARLAREDGDLGVACELAERLVKEFPDSRYSRCAKAVCPSAPAGKKECPEYVLREVGQKGRDER